MEVSGKGLAIGAAALLVAGLAIGRFTLPAKVVTKTTVQVQEKEVVKWRTEFVATKDNNKDYVKVETKKPDGTVITETHIVDRGTTQINKVADGTDTKSSVVTVTHDKSETFSKNDWHVSALASPSGDGHWLQPTVSYGLQVERRIIGPFYVGAFGLANKTIGASLGVSF